MATREPDDPAILLLRAQQVQAAAYETMARAQALRGEIRQVIALVRLQIVAGQTRRQQQVPGAGRTSTG